MWAAIVGGIAGLITGVLGSLVAPWVALKVDRQRQDHDDKRQRVAEWRAGLAKVEEEVGSPDASEFPGLLVMEPWYGSLRPHLPETVRQALETPGRVLIVEIDGARRHYLARNLSNEIDRIAQDWGVV